MPFALCSRALLPLALATFTLSSQAAFIDAPVPVNATITFNGLQWAWASPVAGDGSFGPGTALDLSYQSQFGWRLPTLAELVAGPKAPDFIFSGANVPGGYAVTDPVSGALNSYGARPAPYDMACASPYFNNWARTCNYGNGPGSGAEFETVWWGMPGAPIYADTLVVRAIPGVPEPSTYALMALGVAGLMLRRRFTR